MDNGRDSGQGGGEAKIVNGAPIAKSEGEGEEGVIDEGEEDLQAHGAAGKVAQNGGLRLEPEQAPHGRAQQAPPCARRGDNPLLDWLELAVGQDVAPKEEEAELEDTAAKNPHSDSMAEFMDEDGGRDGQQKGGRIEAAHFFGREWLLPHFVPLCPQPPPQLNPLPRLPKRKHGENGKHRGTENSHVGQ